MPTYTVCFCGTACSRDEGEIDRVWKRTLRETKSVSKKGIYDVDTGYIPVRIHLDISQALRSTASSATVRGVGENDWADSHGASDLLLKAPIAAPSQLHSYINEYADGRSQRGTLTQAFGWSATALALHGANLAAASVKNKFDSITLLGHSRGAVAAIMAAWFLYAYGGPVYRNIPVNIFAIDPVPGTGDWYGILTQLPPNVRNYVGVYAWDHLDVGFSPVVPRPNFWMTQHTAHCNIERQPLGTSWDALADNGQLDDPLAPNKNKLDQPRDYHLYASRGRHGTVAGIKTRDGLYDPLNTSEEVAPVPRLVYKLARAYLTQWGTVFPTRSRVRESARLLRTRIHTAHTDLDAMAGGETRTSRVSGRLSVRQISSTSGRLVSDKYYMEDVVGDPPHRLAYPCTIERRGGGWVKWKFL